MVSKKGGNAPWAADLDKMVNTLYQCKSALTYNFFDDLHLANMTTIYGLTITY